jgi:hypothetical protein
MTVILNILTNYERHIVYKSTIMALFSGNGIKEGVLQCLSAGCFKTLLVSRPYNVNRQDEC